MIHEDDLGGPATPPKVVSPDGTQEWDGARWVPRQNASTWAPLPQPASRPLSWRWLVIGGLAIAAVIAVGAGIALTAGVLDPPLLSASGEMTLKATSSPKAAPSAHTTYTEKFIILADGQECAGWQGYADINGGATVAVRDEADRLIGSARLLPGHYNGTKDCTFRFTVDRLPVRAFYQFEVTHRGRITVSRAELSTGVTLTL